MIFNLSKLRIPLDDSLQNKSTGVSAQGPKICWFLSISFLVVVVAAAAAVVMVDGRQSLCNSFPRENVHFPLNYVQVGWPGKPKIWSVQGFVCRGLLRHPTWISQNKNFLSEKQTRSCFKLPPNPSVLHSTSYCPHMFLLAMLWPVPRLHPHQQYWLPLPVAWHVTRRTLGEKHLSFTALENHIWSYITIYSII